MKLLFVFTEQFNSYGGIQRFNRALLDGIYYKNNHNFSSIILLNDGKKSIRKGSVKNRKYLYCNNSKLGLVIKFIREVFSKPDLIFLSHINFSPLASLARILSPRSKIVIIFFGYEVWKEISSQQNWGINKANLIVCISEFTKNRFLKFNETPKARMQIVHLSLDPDWQHNVDRIDISNHNNIIPRCNHPFILTVSRLSSEDGQYKGIDLLIESIARLRNIDHSNNHKLIIVGEGDDKSRLQNLSKLNQVDDFVTFLGSITDLHLHHLYANCDIFALPSKGEGFGLVYLEAMSYSKPVIAGDQGACSEIVIDGETGYLVRHGDIEQLSNKLSLLMRTPELREKLGENGRRRVDEYFTFPHFVERLEKVLEPLLE